MMRLVIFAIASVFCIASAQPSSEELSRLKRIWRDRDACETLGGHYVGITKTDNVICLRPSAVVGYPIYIKEFGWPLTADDQPNSIF